MIDDIQLIECPRDAWQGRVQLIPTPQKISYIQQLLSVGFHTLDVGSFVSPKAVPQLADTHEMLRGLDLKDTQTKLLVILANQRGAQEASQHPYLQYWGFPLSISETFQQRNTRQSIAESIELSKYLQEQASRSKAELVIYISMAFGNPYLETYHSDQVLSMAGQLHSMGVKIVSLADTVGLASPEEVGHLVATCQKEFPSIQWGVHLHARPEGQREKIAAAYAAGCRRYDGAIGGWGGCPFADDEMVGNIDTKGLIDFLSDKSPNLPIDRTQLDISAQLAKTIFE
ncbi:MAG: hydroxymethylglutaryl-CoA lyase [Bacteroidota bacterium]